MNTKRIAISTKRAIIEAEGNRRLYSEIDTKFVRNGQGSMSQRMFIELMKKRAEQY